MLVGAYHRAIDKVLLPIQCAGGIALALQFRQDAVPNAALAPAIEAAGDRAPGTEVLWQVPPRSAGTQDPANALNDPAMVMRGAARFRFLRGQQRFKPCPLLVCQGVSVHTLEYERLVYYGLQ